MSFLHIVERCDNFNPQNSADVLAPFTLTPSSESAVGLLRPEVVAALRADNERRVTQGAPASWAITERAGRGLRVSFAAALDTPEARSRALQALCAGWRDAGRFADVAGPRLWRDELYAVYRNPFGARAAADTAFTLERAAAALFGVVTYGVHMTVYHAAAPGGDVHIWVPTRARTKQTWPGYLDNSVAGGIPAGMSAFDAIVKESMEEASIEESQVRKHARAAGAVSYFFQTANGWLQPEVQFVYDLCVPFENGTPSFQPKPLDGEVASFELLPLPDVIVKMHAGLFKPNCALVLLDFLVRHGHVTPDDEPHFLEIVTRLHGRFAYDRW